MGSLTIPLIPPWYCTGTILLVLVIDMFKKSQNPICTFHLHPSYRHTYRHTDAPTSKTVAPNTVHFFSPNLNSETLPNHKLNSFLVISVTTPYQIQNAPLNAGTLATLCTSPNALVCKTSPLKD